MFQANSNKTSILCIIDILKKHTDSKHTLTPEQIQDILESEYGLKLDMEAVKRNLTDLIDMGFDVGYSERIRKNKSGENETVYSDFYITCAFDNSEFEKYKVEAQEKWGKTDAYKQHEERTKNYSKQKWNDLAEGMDRIMAEFAVCLRNGEKPDSIETQSLVKTLQNHITENYYLCTNEILAGLGQMYVADERFKNNIDKHADGTAYFICKAIKIYCCK